MKSVPLPYIDCLQAAKRLAKKLAFGLHIRINMMSIVRVTVREPIEQFVDSLHFIIFLCLALLHIKREEEV